MDAIWMMLFPAAFTSFAEPELDFHISHVSILILWVKK